MYINISRRINCCIFLGKEEYTTFKYKKFDLKFVKLGSIIDYKKKIMDMYSPSGDPREPIGDTYLKHKEDINNYYKFCIDKWESL